MPLKNLRKIIENYRVAFIKYAQEQKDKILEYYKPSYHCEHQELPHSPNIKQDQIKSNKELGSKHLDGITMQNAILLQATLLT